jgi:pilus assembly protein CpaE
LSDVAREHPPMMLGVEEPGGQQVPADPTQPAPGHMPGKQESVPAMGGAQQSAPEGMPVQADPMAQPAPPMDYGTDQLALNPDPMAASSAPVPPEGEILPDAQDATPEPVAPIASPDEDWVAPNQATAVPQAQPVSVEDVRGQPLPRINIQAFCDDQNTANVLTQASQDRRLSKTHMNIQMGGMDAASHYYRNVATPNLIIIESMHKRDAMVMDVDRLASVCDAGTKVVVIGHVNDVLLYRELKSRGVSEYLVMPLNVSQVMESLSNLYNDPGSDPLGNVIAFVGAKGGAGASTVCHNTAWAISQSVMSDVVIADLDLPFGTAGLDFNQDPVQGIADALLSPDRMDEVLLDRLLSRCSDYLSLFAAPGTLDRPYDLSAGACDTVVDVLRKNVPYIAIDVPHVWTEWAQRVMVQADRIVITALPDLANLRNTKNLIEKLGEARPNDLAPFLVINQVGVPKRPEISVEDFASAIDTEPTAVIEFDSQLFGTATNNGQMIEEVSPKAKSAEVFRELARVLTDRTEVKVESKSLFSPILDKFKLKKSGK